MYSPLGLSVDEAQYWDWSNKLDLGYFSKPPLIAWLISFSTLIFGNEEWAVRLFSPIIHLFISIVLWSCSNSIYGTKAGSLTAIIWITLPATSLGSFLISTDTPLLFFWSLGLLSLIKIIKNGSLFWVILLGITAGLGFLAKYAILYFIILMIIFFLVHYKNKILNTSSLIIFLIIFFIIISPNIIWNLQNKLSTFNHTIYNADISGFNLNIYEALIFVSSQFLVFGPLLFLIFIINVWKFFFGKTELSLLAYFSIPIVLLLVLQAILKTANANWAITAYPAACIIISSIILIRKSTFTKFIISTGILINIIISIFILKVSITGDLYPISLESDPLRKLKGYEKQAILIHKLIEEEKPISILYDRRNEITKFSYYLNRNNLEFYERFYISDNERPVNHYDQFYNFSENNLKSDDPIIFITRNDGIGKNFMRYFSEFELLKKLEYNHSFKSLRKVYIFKGIIK